jgi:uncharacterized membrane protein
VGILGVALVAGCPSLAALDLERIGVPPQLKIALLTLGAIELWPGTVLFVAYPVLPWLGIMAAGYGCGEVWLLRRRRLWLALLGAATLALFLLIRGLNDWGDPRPWSVQGDSLMTVLSFINCTKYPPSPDFVLMTLGPALLALALLDRPAGPLARPLIVLGRVPLFYYLLHAPLIHAIALLFALARYGHAGFLLGHPAINAPAKPEGYGYGLPVVYLVSLGVVVALYPACLWFSQLKRRYPGGWLSYL